MTRVSRRLRLRCGPGTEVAPSSVTVLAISVPSLLANEVGSPTTPFSVATSENRALLRRTLRASPSASRKRRATRPRQVRRPTRGNGSRRGRAAAPAHGRQTPKGVDAGRGARRVGGFKVALPPLSVSRGRCALALLGKVSNVSRADRPSQPPLGSPDLSLAFSFRKSHFGQLALSFERELSG